MSFSGVEFLRGLIERGDPDALHLLREDAEWIVPGDARYGGGTHRGWPELVGFFRLVGDLFPDGLRFDPGREWQNEESIVVEATLDGTTAAKRPYRNDYLFVLELDGSKVKRITEYTDTSRAEQILGGPHAEQ